MIVHPAHAVPFDELVENLNLAMDRRYVVRKSSRDGTHIYLYTNACMYDGAWDDTTRVARGLILDLAAKKIVATPFPKFFNYGEQGITPPDEPFEVTEKVDGSLIIIYWRAGQWLCATRGAFDTSQALWVKAQLDGSDLSALRPGVTYLAEAVYADNRIVIRYADEALKFLAAYDENGWELSYREVAAAARAIGFEAAARFPFKSLSELAASAKGLSADQEGYVIRFASGLRIKLKGDEYSRMHAVITGVTPLNIWALMAAGDDLESIRQKVPEEYWADFDAIANILGREKQSLLSSVSQAANAVSGLDDREVG